MATLDFPTGQANGYIHTHEGKQWQYVSADSKWVAYGASLAPDVLKVDTANNRVGINDTTPSYSLDVNGTAQITGATIIGGNLTVSGTTTSLSTTNTVVTDTLMELNTGASSNANDMGILMERGSTGNNAFMGFDESADKFTVGLTTNVASDTGNLTIATGTMVADLEGDVTGDVTGNADTATALAASVNIGGVAFTGAASINLPGVNTAGTQATSGNAATATTAGTVTTAAQGAITSVGTLTGLTMGGELAAVDQTISRPVMKDYAETKVAMGANAVDLSLGNVQTYTLSGNQTLTFTNPPASGSAGSFTLIVTNGGSATLTWPTSVDWAAATAPTLTSSGVDVLTFLTVDGGTIWYGFLAGAAMA